MTQRMMNDSSSNYSGDNSAGSSEEIRENIEYTRRKMGSRIDQIQERLDPKYLREQTQEVVRNAVADGTDAMMEYMRENAKDFGQAIAKTVRQHPLPSALIGLGLVWLIADQFGGSSDESRGRFRGKAEDRYGSNVRHYDYEHAAMQQGYRPEFNRSDYGRSDYSRDYERGSYSDQYPRPYSYAGSMQGAEQRGNGSSLRDKAMGAVSNAAESLRDTVKEWGNEVGEKASEMRHELGERAEEMRHGIGERAGEMRHGMGERAGEVGHQMRHRMSEMGSEAQWQARQFGQQASRQARRVSYENPLMTGAVAFAIGAAAGLLLPSTQKENEWMGEARERFLSNAREAADDVVHRAESLVQEVKPELEQAAREIGDKVKQTGQEAAERVQETVEKTRSKVESEMQGSGEKKSETQPVTGSQAMTGNQPAASTQSTTGSKPSEGQTSSMP